MKRNTNKKQQSRLLLSFRNLSVMQKTLLFFGLFILIVTTLPAVLVLFIGLLPTFTVLITDPKNSNKLVIVGSFNLAGVFVYLLHVVNNFTLHQAFSVVGDIFNLIIMLGTAALGLIIYYEVPNLFIFISRLSSKKRLKKIDAKLEKLAEEWGRDLIDRQKEETPAAPKQN